MGILKENLKGDIRLQKGNIILFEPDEMQYETLKTMITEKSSFEGTLEDEASVDISVFKNILRNLTNIGDEVDEYTDEEIADFESLGNHNLKCIVHEIKKMVQEVGDSILMDMEMEISAFKSLINTVNKADSLEGFKGEFDKLMKKRKMDITFDELIQYSDKPDELREKLTKSNDKPNKTKKVTNSKKK